MISFGAGEEEECPIGCGCLERKEEGVEVVCEGASSRQPWHDYNKEQYERPSTLCPSDTSKRSTNHHE
jgi:hypothetical protein